MTPVRILIADDHEMVRRGVRSVLEQQPGWAVCAEATTGRETVTAAVELRPDVIVLDISMPELNGLEAARQIRHVWPANIIVLTMHDSDELVAEVLDAGARGYVLKSDAGRLLVDAVRAVLEQRTFMTERVNAMARQTAKGGEAPWEPRSCVSHRASAKCCSCSLKPDPTKKSARCSGCRRGRRKRTVRTSWRN
jgi:DNA-binding NarL/FixJ family response regulator